MSTKAPKRQRRIGDVSSSPLLHVVVVESHHHVLEHVHHVLRRKRFQYSKNRRPVPTENGWSMLHVDAHPDMACPPHIPAAACFQPRRPFPKEDVHIPGNTDVSNEKCKEEDLYELLDSTSSGIAEWILPLVLAGNLVHVRWIRPHIEKQSSESTNFPPLMLPQQLRLGSYRFNVGAYIPSSDLESNRKISIGSFLDLPVEARLKVDWIDNCPYYTDDDPVDDLSCVPSSSLVISKPLQLTVSELSSSSVDSELGGNAINCEYESFFNDQPWMLDICLDYFACLNPFLADVQTIDPSVASALLATVQRSVFYEDDVSSHSQITTNYDMALQRRQNLQIFRDLLRDVLRSFLGEAKRTAEYISYADEFKRSTLTFFSDAKVGDDVTNSLISALGRGKRDDDERRRLLQVSLEAIPFLTLPQFNAESEFRAADSSGCSVESPGKPLQECINKSLQRLKETLIQMSRTDDHEGGVPFFVTIARSAQDGFTPASVVEDLQEKVLQTVHDCYCHCSSFSPSTRTNNESIDAVPVLEARPDCQIRVILDYGQWEGSSLDS